MSYERQNFVDWELDDNGKVTKEGTTIKAEHFRHIEDGIVANEKALDGKQPKGDYLTEHQELKTINGQSLVGEGNIEVASIEYVNELFGEKQFDVTSNFVQVNPKPGSEMEVITKISRDENWTLANTLELHQVNSKNVIDLAGYLGGAGTVYEKDGLTATVNDDGTMTVKGTNTSAGWNELIVSAHYRTEYGERIYPPGTYILTGGFGVSIRKAMYTSTGAADAIEGLTTRLYGLFTVNESFRIVDIFLAYQVGAEVDTTFPLGIFRGAAIPDDGYVYSGIVHKVTFDNPVYEGEYNWTTGELKGADGNTIAFYEPKPILGLDGVNAIWTGFGEVTARGKLDDGKEDEGAVEKFDPTVWGLPILALNGDITGMDKNHPKNMMYTYGEHTGLCSMKWQGSSSVAYDKKNFTINFDNAFEAMEGWGAQKKYCTKANYIDHSHARNVVCARLWGETVKSRATVPTVLKNLPNYGAVDGFPIIITINDEFQGLYTMNVPKDGWMFGMGSGTQEAIVCADKWVNATSFKAEALIDGTDFKMEYVTNEDDDAWVATSLNRLINACISSDGSDLDTTIAQYLDWQSAIDYYIFCVLTEGADMTGKNYLLATFDGVKWYFSAYDMDSTFGLHFNGKSFLPANNNPTFAQYASFHRVMELIKLYKKDELKARYTELRESVFSESNIAVLFNNFVGQIPSPVLIQDVKRWPMIPNTSANNVSQIRDYYRLRIAVADKWIEEL